MKKCPFCAEEIQDEAVKCKHCGEFIDEKALSKSGRPWYFSTMTLVIALLCVGPFALPLLWFNPHFSKKAKIVISILVVIASYVLGIALKRALGSLQCYYSQLGILQ